MKLYDPEPDDVFRINITQARSKAERLNVTGITGVEEGKEIIQQLVVMESSSIVEGDRTTVEIRRSKGGFNFESKKISFYGLSPARVKELILDYIKFKDDGE